MINSTAHLRAKFIFKFTVDYLISPQTTKP